MTTGTMNQRSRAPRHPRADGERTRAAILLGADTKFVLNDDPAALDLARQIVRQRLGQDNGGS